MATRTATKTARRAALNTVRVRMAVAKQALPARERAFIAVDPNYQIAKRALDIAVCLVILLPLACMALIVAVAISLDSPGPFLFRQRRVGAQGEEFTCLKFRSMYTGCDDAMHRAASTEFITGGPRRDGDAANTTLGKVHNDPRITRVGRYIRTTSIDELPQFWNVLTGHMTLVGPRPPLPYEVEKYSPYARLRLSGKPGITGPWQVYGRNRVPFEEMVEMDIKYLQKQSLLEDAKLIVLTIPAMLRAPKGA